VVQPPPGSATQTPVLGGGWFLEDEDRDHRSALIQRPLQGGVIVKAQVESEPKQDGHTGAYDPTNGFGHGDIRLGREPGENPIGFDL
jgi:hypothetical protein